MHTAVPVNPASMTGPSHQTGRPVATTTRAPASPARRSASMFRWLTLLPDSSSRVPSMSVTTIAGAGPGFTGRRPPADGSDRAAECSPALSGSPVGAVLGTIEGTVTRPLSPG